MESKIGTASICSVTAKNTFWQTLFPQSAWENWLQFWCRECSEQPGLLLPEWHSTDIRWTLVCWEDLIKQLRLQQNLMLGFCTQILIWCEPVHKPIIQSYQHTTIRSRHIHLGLSSPHRLAHLLKPCMKESAYAGLQLLYIKSFIVRGVAVTLYNITLGVPRYHCSLLWFNTDARELLSFRLQCLIVGGWNLVVIPCIYWTEDGAEDKELVELLMPSVNGGIIYSM